jgi:two-component system response regulator DevR
MDKIRVLMVEDDPVWQEYLSEELEKEVDFFLVGIASTKADAIQLVRLLEVDVILMDLILGDNYLDGIDAAIEIFAFKNAKIIMLTAIDEQEAILEAFAVGAVNYMTKASIQEISDAIRAAYRDHSSIHSDAADKLRKEYMRMTREEQLRVLTTAERQIFELTEQGYSQSKMQQTLHKTERTLKNQVNRMLKKLGAHTLKEALQRIKRGRK